MFEVLRYQDQNGGEPFTEWLHSIRDKQAQAKVRVRLRRLEAGLFGDCESVGDGVLELREHHGAGYRVYFGRHGRTIVILLHGGHETDSTGRHQGRAGVLGRLEAETSMSRKAVAGVSHHAREVAELQADRALAVEYLKAAMESLDDPDDRAAGLLALRTVAEAYGGLGVVAAEAGISREALYRSLSPAGNPTLKTLLAVLRAVGMRLSVEPGERAAA